MTGCYVGDAAGSQILYMLKNDITDEVVEKAMKLEGGGILKMLPG